MGVLAGTRQSKLSLARCRPCSRRTGTTPDGPAAWQELLDARSRPCRRCRHGYGAHTDVPRLRGNAPLTCRPVHGAVARSVLVPYTFMAPLLSYYHREKCCSLRVVCYSLHLNIRHFFGYKRLSAS